MLVSDPAGRGGSALCAGVAAVQLATPGGTVVLN